MDGLNAACEPHQIWCPVRLKPSAIQQKSRLCGRPGDGDIHNLAQKPSGASPFQIQCDEGHNTAVHSLWSVKAAQQSLYRKPTRSSAFFRLTDPQTLSLVRWSGDGDRLCSSPLDEGGFLMAASLLALNEPATEPSQSLNPFTIGEGQSWKLARSDWTGFEDNP